jgi:O-antigen/teichoic acid export membrane protein
MNNQADVPPNPVAVATGSNSGKLIAKNTLYLGVSQALAMPLSVLTNAVSAHYLGASAFGYAYLATTICSFWFLAVGWGQEAVLPAQIARNHALAGVLLGSSLAWRVAASLVVYGTLAVVCHFLNYSVEFQWVLWLTALIFALNYLVAACKDTIRGLERTDIPAYVHVGQQLLTAVLVIAVLMLGGLLRASLAAVAVASAIVFAATWTRLPPVGVGTLMVRLDAIKTLLWEGGPFLLFNMVLELQPNVDALFLSKLAPVEVMGWYGVSRRLVGALLMPSSALIGALYPTLCRLRATDQQGFNQTINAALGTVFLAAAPIAIGTGLFPEIGVALFSRESFRPAEDNLRIMSVLVLLVYLTMPISSAVLAAGRQRIWALVQCLCVVISVAVDPWLVPIFQQRYGNGGLGLCIATVLSEAVMVSFGIALLPAGVFDRKLRRTILLTFISGGAMIVTGLLARPLGSLIAASLAVVTYAIALRVTGAIDEHQMASVISAGQGLLQRFRRKESRE